MVKDNPLTSSEVLCLLLTNAAGVALGDLMSLFALREGGLQIASFR